MADGTQLARVSKLHQKILKWLARTPESAERLMLVVVAMPDHTLMDIEADDAAKLQPNELAQQMADQAEEWAEGSDRECRFVATWFRGEAPVLTLQFRTGNAYSGAGPGTAFDGSAADIIGQMQRHIEAKERTMTGAIKIVLESQNYVIERQRLELEDMRNTVARVSEKEKAIRDDEMVALVDEADDTKLFRLVGLVTEAVKQLQASGVMPTTDTSKH